MDEFEAANEECRHFLDDARQNREPFDPDEVAERQDRAVALAECMRDKGWNVPDPVVGSDGGIQIQNPAGTPAPGDPDFDDYQDDFEKCHEEAGIPVPGDDATTERS